VVFTDSSPMCVGLIVPPLGGCAATTSAPRGASSSLPTSVSVSANSVKEFFHCLDGGSALNCVSIMWSNSVRLVAGFTM
jgi:hypothetical protein